MHSTIKNSEFSTETEILLCVKAAQGPGSVDADSGPDPESKPGPMWPGHGVQTRVRSPDPAKNGLDPCAA